MINSTWNFPTFSNAEFWPLTLDFCCSQTIFECLKFSSSFQCFFCRKIERLFIWSNQGGICKFWGNPSAYKEELLHFLFLLLKLKLLLASWKSLKKDMDKVDASGAMKDSMELQRQVKMVKMITLGLCLMVFVQIVAILVVGYLTIDNAKLVTAFVCFP